MVDRRDFIKTGAITAGFLVSAPWLASAARAPRDHLQRLGVALFTIPKLLDQDFAGALKLLAHIGYKEVEFFSPYPFSVPEAQERWTSIAGSLGLKGSGFFGRSPKEVRTLLDQNGLSAPAAHVDLGTMRTRLEQVADAAHAIGMNYAGISAIPPEERQTLDGYKKMADEFNAIGSKAKALGLRFLYHNHGYGLSEIEGKIPLRVLLDQVDPELVALEMDLFWTVAGGADPVELLNTYPRHYRLMHIKDMKERVRFKGDGGDPSQWIDLFPYMTDPGSGVIDLQKILSRAKTSGVQHFLVEQDLVANPGESLRNSYRFLSGLDA